MTNLAEGAVAGRSEGQPGKRARLVAAACELMYLKGLEGTTLADISQAAGVPLGNMYYYFKTKDQIIDAVIDAQVRDQRATIEAIEHHHRTPRSKLRALIGELAQQSELIAEHGCPHGSLCSELGKRAEGPGSAAGLIQDAVDWVAQQFQAMGRHDARDLAVQLIGAYQGAALLANVLREPGVLTREARRLERWIDSLAPPPTSNPRHGSPSPTRPGTQTPSPPCSTETSG